VKIAYAAVSRYPPVPFDTMVQVPVARTEGYTYAANVWDLSLVQGPFLSPVPIPNVTIRNLFIAARMV
jgi:hypothetical protein